MKHNGNLATIAAASIGYGFCAFSAIEYYKKDNTGEIQAVILGIVVGMVTALFMGAVMAAISAL